MRAQDVMSSPVVTLRPDQPVKDAATVLSANGFTAAPVVDRSGHLVGMITESDVLRERILPDVRSMFWRKPDVAARPAATVAEVMTTPTLSVKPTTDAADIARMMLSDRVRSIPVTDSTGVVGIVTRGDLLRLIATSDGSIRAAVLVRLGSYGGSDRWTVSVKDGAITIVDDFDHETDRHVARVIAESVPGAASVEVTSRQQAPAASPAAAPH